MMNLEARKLSLIQEFLRVDNEQIITALENLLHKIKSEKLEEKIGPMSLEQFNEEIDQAIKDEKEERVISNSDLKQKIKKWS